MEESLKFLLTTVVGSIGFFCLLLSHEHKNQKPNRYRVYKTVGLLLMGAMVAMFIMKKNLWW